MVHSLGKPPDGFMAEMLGQPSALRRAAEGLVGQIDALAALAEQHENRPVLFTGMGTSYNTCYVPVTLLAGTGRSAGMVDTAELLHFRRPVLRQDTILILVSQSGRSAEVVALVEAMKEGHRPLVVSITNGLDNPLAQAGDISLDTRTGPEKGPSTMTFGATLVLLAAVAEVLGGGLPTETVRNVAETADRVAAMVGTLLEGKEELAGRLIQWWGQRPVVVVLGRGTARAASETGALLLKEAARLPAEALESGQFRHGPLELAGPDLAAAVVATEPNTEHLDTGIAAEGTRMDAVGR